MSIVGKKKTLISAYSLIEIIVSLAIFSFIFTGVITVSIHMLNAEKKIQAHLFLTQTAQTTIESMSRQLRYGYNFTGSTRLAFESSEAGQTISINLVNTSTDTGSSATTTQNLINAVDSPFILFESQGGNPNNVADQNAFCAYGGKLFKISQFQVETNGLTYKARCDSGTPLLPENIILEKVSFDIYAGTFQAPKNPTVRVKLRIKHEETGSLDLQTTVTQRLVSYF